VLPIGFTVKLIGTYQIFDERSFLREHPCPPRVEARESFWAWRIFPLDSSVVLVVEIGRAWQGRRG
jgi:hypothetical protein